MREAVAAAAEIAVVVVAHRLASKRRIALALAPEGAELGERDGVRASPSAPC